MDTFTDYYNNKVTLSFKNHPFSKQPKHVWVICIYNGKWLLTEHKERGLEFPGGKVEEGETAEDAAVREVMEETGGVVEQLFYIGQYYVAGKSDQVIKNVYFAEINHLTVKDDYFETNGPVLISEIPRNVRFDRKYSFIMKDNVQKKCVQYIKDYYLTK